MNTSVIEAQVAQYELEIDIESSAESAWTALVDETNAWWLADFHMVGPDSTVTFETHAGGGLIEHLEGSGSLLWYTVQYCQPNNFTIFLVGSLAPDYGGPTTNHLKLQVVPDGDARCVLRVTDAHFGRINEGSMGSLESGWMQLFSDGLKKYVESK